MKISRRSSFVLLMLLYGLWMTGMTQEAVDSTEKDGTLVVLVTWGDMHNTPATNVYVEAYGFVRKDGLNKSFVLHMSHPGRYEASLPPGVYDVFISEGTSVPRCKRVLIGPGATEDWTLQLEVDLVYAEKSNAAGR